MRFSASQLSLYRTCPRKWWMRYCLGLPEDTGDSRKFDFGTVLHSAVERFLLGQELWPKGWSRAESKFGGEPAPPLSAVDQSTIKLLVQKAIDEGIIRAEPGIRVEREFRIDLDRIGFVTGYIDASYGNTIEDHKTTKNIRYAETRNSLPKNSQMLLYAKVLADEQPEQNEFVLVHNQFVKDPAKPRVRKVTARVDRKTVEAAWSEARRDFFRMHQIRKNVRKKEQLAIPEGHHYEVCGKYGGCDFLPICGGLITEKDYADKRGVTLRVLGQPEEPETHPAPAPEEQKENQVNLRDMIKEVKTQQSGDAPTAPVEEEASKEEAPVEEAQEPVAPEVEEPADDEPEKEEKPKGKKRGRKPKNPPTEAFGTSAPWADDDMSGFLENGEVDKKQVMTAMDDDRPLPRDFEISHPDDKPGVAVLVPKNGGSETVMQYEVRYKEAPEPVKASVIEKSEPTPEKTDTVTADGTPSLLVNVAALNAEEAVNIMPMIAAWKAEIVESEKPGGSWWHLDPFKRKDLLQAKAEEFFKSKAAAGKLFILQGSMDGASDNARVAQAASEVGCFVFRPLVP